MTCPVAEILWAAAATVERNRLFTGAAIVVGAVGRPVEDAMAARQMIGLAPGYLEFTDGRSRTPATRAAALLAEWAGGHLLKAAAASDPESDSGRLFDA